MVLLTFVAYVDLFKSVGGMTILFSHLGTSAKEVTETLTETKFADGIGSNLQQN